MSSLLEKVYFFLSNLDAFSLSCPKALARTSRKMLSRGGKKGWRCPAPGLGRKAFSLTPLIIMLTVGFLYDFMRLRKFYSQSVECFYHERM